MKHHAHVYGEIVLLIVLAAVLPVMSRSHAADERCFRETGQCISGRFRVYWEQHGGLPVFGYPITPAREEFSAETGQVYLIQWFERARFELHPENPPPYDVLLGRVGADVLREKGIDWWTLPTGQPRDGCLYFEATRHTLCEPFLSYWRIHGLELDGHPGKSFEESLALLGAPLSEPRWELHGGLNASVRLTQWFERARFEWNPEQTMMTMGLLGVELYALRNPLPPAPPEPTPAPPAPEPAPAPAPTELTAVPSRPTPTPAPADEDGDEDEQGDQGEEGTPTLTPTATEDVDTSPTPTTTITPTPSPTLPPRSLNDCRDDPNKASAANFPVRIVSVDKDDQVVRLRNESEVEVDLTGWTMCSIRTNQVHEGIGGVLDPNETRNFEYTGGGRIWNPDRNNNGALYNENGQLVSYWFDPES